MKRVIYTATFGGYDTICPVSFKSTCEYYLFTDDPSCKVRGWQTVHIDRRQYPNLSSAELNRYFKIITPEICKNYDQSLYIDGHVQLNRDPELLFEKYLNLSNIALPPHPFHKSIYEEAEYCAATGIVDKDLVKAQMERYVGLGLPRDFSLTENGIMLRNHRAKEIIALMEAWWNEYISGVRRDQLSLPFLLWKLGVNPGIIAEGPRYSSKYFTLKPHTTRQMSWWKSQVWHIQTHRERNHLYRGVSNVIDHFQRMRTKC